MRVFYYGFIIKIPGVYFIFCNKQFYCIMTTVQGFHIQASFL